MASGPVVAVTFLTRVPTRGRVEGPSDLARSIPYFPVVGAVIGGMLGLVYVAGSELWTAPVAAALSLTTGLLLTGALHEDGLADSADALGGAFSREDALRIMRDPTHGSYGVLALIVSFVGRLLALASLAPGEGLVVLIAAHSFSRAVAVATLQIAPAASDEGLGAAYSSATSRGRVLASVGIGLVIVAVSLGPWSLVVVGASVPGVVVLVRLAVRKLGGITGDILGAAQQVTEMAVLLVGAAVAGRGMTLSPWA